MELQWYLNGLALVDESLTAVCSQQMADSDEGLTASLILLEGYRMHKVR